MLSSHIRHGSSDSETKSAYSKILGRAIQTKVKHASLYQNMAQADVQSIFYASTEKPLNIWDKQIRRGQIKRVEEKDGEKSLQIIGSLYTTFSTFIMAPSTCVSLGIPFPHLVFIMKRLYRGCAIDVQVLDDKNIRRRFRFYNMQKTIQKTVPLCLIPLVLTDGWNEVKLNLAEYTKKLYGTQYVECIRIKIYPNCRVRHVYFTAFPIIFERVFYMIKTKTRFVRDCVKPQIIQSKITHEPYPKTMGAREAAIRKLLPAFDQSAPQEVANSFKINFTVKIKGEPQPVKQNQIHDETEEKIIERPKGEITELSIQTEEPIQAYVEFQSTGQHEPEVTEEEEPPNRQRRNRKNLCGCCWL